MYNVEILCKKNDQLVSQTSTRQHTTFTTTTKKSTPRRDSKPKVLIARAKGRRPTS